MTREVQIWSQNLNRTTFDPPFCPKMVENWTSNLQPGLPTKAPPSKTVSSINNIPPFIDQLLKEGNVSDLNSSLSDKNALTSPRDEDHKSATKFSRSNHGIKAHGIRNTLLVTSVKRMQDRCFPAKHELDRSDTQDMEEGWATQRVRL